MLAVRQTGGIGVTQLFMNLLVAAAAFYQIMAKKSKWNTILSFI
jgi:hypothetical protein